MTDQPRVELPLRIPKPVLAAMIGLALQIVAGFIGAASFLTAAASALFYLEDRSGTLAAIRAISYLITFLLAVGATAMIRGKRWGGELVVVLEILVFVIGLLGLFVVVGIDTLDPTVEMRNIPVVVATGVTSLVLPVAVCGLLATRSARNWLV